MLKLYVGAARCRSVGVREIRARWWECDCVIYACASPGKPYIARHGVEKRNVIQRLFAKKQFAGKGKKIGWSGILRV